MSLNLLFYHFFKWMPSIKSYEYANDSYDQSPTWDSSQYLANINNASLNYHVDKSLSNIIIISLG